MAGEKGENDGVSRESRIRLNLFNKSTRNRTIATNIPTIRIDTHLKLSSLSR